jgi:tyrosinase
MKKYILILLPAAGILLLAANRLQRSDEDLQQEAGIVICKTASDVLPRKNVDDLTKDELEAYVYAWKILKERSQANPFDTSGYLWQAWVHNRPAIRVPVDGTPKIAYPGKCEHGNTLFMPWHRAELYYFEKILQQTDPDGLRGPSTKNVTIPYWNWLRSPSGKRIPQVFEDTASVLYQHNRYEEPVSDPFISPFHVASLVYHADWLQFGGGPVDNPGFGEFEDQVHNPMHGFIGDDMADARYAALDPVFYSFHCYIDLLYEEWLEVHGSQTVSSSDFYLRGTQPKGIPEPPGFTTPPAGGQVMGQSKNYFDTRALGYFFDIRAGDELPTRASVDLLRMDPTPFGSSDRSLQTRLMTGGVYQADADNKGVLLAKEIMVPAARARRADLLFFPELILDSINYQVDVYLHPIEVLFSAAKDEHREKYLAESFVHWGKGSHHHPQQGHHNQGHTAVPKPFVIRLDNELNSLVATQKGSVWAVKVFITTKDTAQPVQTAGKLEFQVSQ